MTGCAENRYLDMQKGRENPAFFVSRLQFHNTINFCEIQVLYLRRQRYKMDFHYIPKGEYYA